MEENNIKENKKGINFFKKVWYSVMKFDKYIEMSNEGAKKSTKYLMLIILTMSIIIAAVGIYDTNKVLDEGIEYLNKEVPEFSYSNEQLNVELDDVVKLEDTIFGLGNIIVDTQTEEDSKIEEYKNEIAESEDRIGIIILKNKIIQVVETKQTETEQIATNEITYSYVATSLLGKTSAEFSKADLISFVDGSGRAYISFVNLLIYVIGYFITYLLSIVLYVVLLALIGNITSLITKIRIKFSTLYSISIYALTLPNILSVIYFIVRYFSGWQIKYFDIAYMAIAYVYLVTILFLIKTDMIKKQEQPVCEEENKKEEEKKEREENG